MLKANSITRKQLTTLIVCFAPAMIGLVSFLALSLIQNLYDLPAVLDIEASSHYTDEQSFGISLVNILWPIFVICYFIWIPFILAGLVRFILQSPKRGKYAKN